MPTSTLKTMFTNAVDELFRICAHFGKNAQCFAAAAVFKFSYTAASSRWRSPSVKIFAPNF